MRWLFGLVLVLTACQPSRQAGEKAILFDPSWPSASVGSKKANVTGLVIDFITHSAERPYGFSVHDHLLYRLEQKECAAVIASIPMVGINQEKFAFSEPLIRTGPLFVTKADSTNTSFENKKIALEENSPAYLIAQKIEGASLALYTNISQAFEDLDQGKVDAILTSALTAKSYLSGIYKGRLREASEPLDEEGIRVITLKGQPLAKPEKSQVAELQTRWGLVLDPLDS